MAETLHTGLLPVVTDGGTAWSQGAWAACVLCVGSPPQSSCECLQLGPTLFKLCDRTPTRGARRLLPRAMPMQVKRWHGWPHWLALPWGVEQASDGPGWLLCRASGPSAHWFMSSSMQGAPLCCPPLICCHEYGLEEPPSMCPLEHREAILLGPGPKRMAGSCRVKDTQLPWIHLFSSGIPVPPSVHADQVLPSEPAPTSY